MFADVAFPISSYKTFTYNVPKSMIDEICVGSRVSAPLGTRSIQGIVVSLKKHVKYKGKLKPVTSLVDDKPVLDEKLWKLIKWVSEYYMVPLGKAATVALPSRLSTRYTPQVHWTVKLIKSKTRVEISKRAVVQKRILDYLSKGQKEVPVSSLGTLGSNPLQVCRRLVDLGVVILKKHSHYAKATGFMIEPVHRNIRFTKDQKEVLSQISDGLNIKKFSSFLLHGVTGSGKTEIYIEAARQTLAQNRTVIILLPEIALTPQIAGRFRSVFGESVALWHSRLGQAERAGTWKRICANEYKVIVGARSAIFVPLRNLGLIVVDEEQESSFKQESPDPRYHARETALMRAKIHGAVVMLSSATPSLESYYNQVQGKLSKLHLPERFGDSKYPQVHVVDMNKEAEETGKASFIFSSLLQDKIADRLNKGEQVILLQNRRGHSPVIRCRDCGAIEMCPHCEVSLTFHSHGKIVRCHVCGFEQASPPETCRQCSSDQVQLQGIGTQRVENLVAATFPAARMERLDIDTAQTAAKISSTLTEFGKGNIDILLGTQMIAKGLDFENATLVGIINADTGLFLPDFRAGERVFQLIYQAAGRSGRRKKPGEVVIQTYNSESPVIQASSKLALKKYYNILLSERRELNYPPFSWMVKIEFMGKSKSSVEAVSAETRGRFPKPYAGLDILGPALCYRERIRDQWRMQIVLKSNKEKDPVGDKIHAFLRKGISMDEIMKQPRGVRIAIDVNPVSLQ